MIRLARSVGRGGAWSARSRRALLPALFGLCALAACRPQAPASETARAPGAVAPASVDAFLTLPGDYSQGTTLAALEARFGKASLRVDTTAEGREVVLFPEDPGRRAYLRFHDDAALENLASIWVRDAGSRWRGKHGVHVGMSFAKLRELNGKPFYFFGFDELKRGWVRDQWSPSLGDDDATLGAFDVGEQDHLYFDVDLGLCADAPEPAASALPVEESTSSDDARFPRMGEWIVVTGFGASSSLDDEWE